MKKLTFENLHDAVAGKSVAIRSRMTLQPAGGIGDKIFPPTYSQEAGERHKYAVEERYNREDGTVVTTVLLDSVASQANRAELALLDAIQRKEVKFPVPYVDFSGFEELVGFSKLTALEAPHRIADAIFRDSLIDGTLFRLSDTGLAVTNAAPNNATELFRICPTALLFGMWDSTGPKGGLGSRFQRAYVSEIVGFNAQIGKKVGSRIDPLQLEKVEPNDVVYNSAIPAEVWTHDEAQAEKNKRGKPVHASRGSASGTAGQPSKINHGNIPPTIDSDSGGVTISHAEQTTVISFPALRKLRFPGMTRNAENAARTAISALGLAAMSFQLENDFDLRSRCLLLPMHPPQIEFLNRDGSDPDLFELDRKTSAQLVTDAANYAASQEIPWEKSIKLVPAEKLIALIRRSRKVSEEGS